MIPLSIIILTRIMLSSKILKSSKDSGLMEEVQLLQLGFHYSLESLVKVGMFSTLIITTMRSFTLATICSSVSIVKSKSYQELQEFHRTTWITSRTKSSERLDKLKKKLCLTGNLESRMSIKVGIANTTSETKPKLTLPLKQRIRLPLVCE
jgi:hypothetical protein